MKYRFELLSVTLILGFILSSCTGTKSSVEQAQDNAVTIEVVAEAVVDEGLRFLEREDPELVDPIIGDLQEVVNQIMLYNDGKASVGDFVETFTAVLDRLNLRAEFIEDEDARLVIRNINRTGRILETYFDEYDLPPEVPIYANALATGITLGIAPHLPPAEEPIPEEPFDPNPEDKAKEENIV